MSYSRLQRTISQPVAVRGYGFWSGEPVQLEFRPAAAGAGITFVRSDLGEDALVPAKVQYRIDVPRRTNLQCNGVRVEMVEHVLAALAGLQIDNCEVVASAAEMPGCDGSSRAFVEALDRAGIEEQQGVVSQLEITELVRITDGQSWIEARPATAGEYVVDFQLDYPDDSVIGCQDAMFKISPEAFRDELSDCRSFVLKREADAFVQKGLGTHLTPRDLLVFGEHGPIDNSLRYENECARHKALDLVGDLALTGYEIVGRIVAYRSSHKLNSALAAELLKKFSPVTPLKASA